MTGVVRKALLLAVLALAAVVSVAAAGIPNPANCTIPTAIRVGGCNGAGAVDPTISFSVTIRDIGNFPVANQPVAVSFNSDVKIFDAFPGFVSCQCVEAITDLTGVATFRVPGGGRGGAFYGTSAATFYGWNFGNTLVLGTAHVAMYDENGGVATKGVDITDLGAWGSDYLARLTPPTAYRSDLNLSGAVEITDLGAWASVYLAQTSKFSCGNLCP